MVGQFEVQCCEVIVDELALASIRVQTQFHAYLLPKGKDRDENVVVFHHRLVDAAASSLRVLPTDR